jgi:hypothetical protein
VCHVHVFDFTYKHYSWRVSGLLAAACVTTRRIQLVYVRDGCRCRRLLGLRFRFRTGWSSFFFLPPVPCTHCTCWCSGVDKVLLANTTGNLRRKSTGIYEEMKHGTHACATPHGVSISRPACQVQAVDWSIRPCTTSGEHIHAVRIWDLERSLTHRKSCAAFSRIVPQETRLESFTNHARAVVTYTLAALV